MNIALFSGGLASFEATLKILEKNFENTEIWFFDTLIEDQDTYRFINESENFFNKKIYRFFDGRNPWEVFRDERFIGNSYKTPCNRVLKRKLLVKAINEISTNESPTLIFGISKEENRRTDKITEGWKKKNIPVRFPLIENTKYKELSYKEFETEYKIEVPRLYKLGFRHNNCGGACVKAGIRQWLHLYEVFPHRYSWHEEEEQKMRVFLNRNVSILRDRHGGLTKPLTLKELRIRYTRKRGYIDGR